MNHNLDNELTHLPEAIRSRLARLKDNPDKAQRENDAVTLIERLNEALLDDVVNEDDATVVLRHIEWAGVVLKGDPLEPARVQYRRNMSQQNPHTVGIHIEGLSLGESRMVANAIADAIDPLHGCGVFLEQHLPMRTRPNGKPSRSSVAIANAIKASRLDFHEVVSFGDGSWSHLFGSTRRFIEFANPGASIELNRDPNHTHLFAPAVILFTNPAPFGKQVTSLLRHDTKYQKSDRRSKHDRLYELLKCVPVRLVPDRDGNLLVFRLNEASVKGAKMAGARIQRELIDELYDVETYVALNDPVAIGTTMETIVLRSIIERMKT